MNVIEIEPVNENDENESENINITKRINREVKMGRRNEQTSIHKHMNILTHTFILAFVLFVIYLCFHGDIVFFTWHPLFMSVGWVLLMTEAILVLNGNNIVVKHLSHVERVRCHWIMQTIGVSFIATAFAIIFINKNNIHKKHFTSWHGLIGLAAVIFSMVACAGGTFALYSYSLRRYIKPNTTKLIHCTGGILTFSIGGMTVLLSLWSLWFERKVNERILSKIIGVMLITTVFCWTLKKPLETCYCRFKKLQF